MYIKFPLDNFHLQYPSAIIQSSEDNANKIRLMNLLEMFCEARMWLILHETEVYITHNNIPIIPNVYISLEIGNFVN
jgi:hypothetical protein